MCNMVMGSVNWSGGDTYMVKEPLREKMCEPKPLQEEGARTMR